MREPWCRLCRARGQYTIATIVDHVVNLAAGGTETNENRAPICEGCHSTKTKEEAKRGRAY
jgi:5-methylcytosine-specific restriction protein A